MKIQRCWGGVIGKFFHKLNISHFLLVLISLSSSVLSFCGASSIEQAHPLVRPAHSIPTLLSPILAGASHCCATKSYLGWRIPSPAPPYLILASASSPRRHSISASASPPRRNFYLCWRIIATPRFLSRTAHYRCAAVLSWPAHHCRATISISAGASSPHRHILSRPAHHCLAQ